MRILIALFSAIILSAAPVRADKYEFDGPHTNILFFISHVGFSEMVGRFSQFSGDFNFDEKNPAKSSVNVTLKPAGIRTSSEALDAHLQKEEFFNSAKFPEIKFASREVKVTGENTADVTGDLTLLGVTKPVVLHVKLNKADYHPITGDFMAGFTAETTIKRSDFGMTAYVPVVGDEVRLFVSTEGVNQDRKKKDMPKHG